MLHWNWRHQIDITEKDLQEFLNRLSECYQHEGRIYLVGGSSLILHAAKESTLDIDLQIDIPPNHHTEFIQCLRRLSRQLNIPVEEASPGQFIPLPYGYQDRHQFIGRYGKLDVFHFDFYSVALSKLYRGNEKDFQDTIQMVRRNLIELARLRAYFQEILPKIETFRINADPEAFQRQFAAFEQRLAND